MSKIFYHPYVETLLETDRKHTGDTRPNCEAPTGLVIYLSGSLSRLQAETRSPVHPSQVPQHSCKTKVYTRIDTWEAVVRPQPGMPTTSTRAPGAECPTSSPVPCLCTSLEAAGNGSSSWVPTTPMGDLDWVPARTQANASIWGVKPVESSTLFFLLPPLKKLKKKKRKIKP